MEKARYLQNHNAEDSRDLRERHHRHLRFVTLPRTNQRLHADMASPGRAWAGPAPNDLLRPNLDGVIRCDTIEPDILFITLRLGRLCSQRIVSDD